MSMTPENYSARRDELLSELQEILKIEGLPDKTAKELKAVSRKLVSNVFNIVLIGEFQGGKSTTFNSICDGREISPRGAMIKTSACKISAQNLPDPDAAEYAILEWKQESELIETIRKIIAPYLREKAPARFGNLQDSEISNELHLTDEGDVRLIKACLDDEWERYSASPADYDPDGEGNLDILYIASLIVENCARQDFRDKLVGKANDNGDVEPIRTRISIPELAKYVVFPKEWNRRWEQKQKAATAFLPDEVAFAFLGSVMCYLHSPNLARLGCVVTDCPGLFASPWDTRVAWEAMVESDAILYLIGGDKAMSNKDLKALKQIRSTKQDHKLFFAVNARIKKDLLISKILPANVGFLHNAGFPDVNESNIYVFHSLLGLCSRNGVAIKNHELDDVSLERFVRVAHYADDTYPEDAAALWPLLVEDRLRDYLSRAEFANKDIYLDDITALGDVSGMNALLNVIENTVVLKKAEALLVSGGSKPINEAMVLLEGELRNQESLATKNKDKFAEEERKAREILNAFAKEATTEIDTIIEPRWANGLSYDFFDNVILSNADELADRVSGQFADNVLSFNNLLTALNKNALKAKLEPLIKDATTAVMKPAIAGWLQNIETGDNKVYNDTLQVQRQEIISTLKKKWAELKVADQDTLLDGLDKLIDNARDGTLVPPDLEPDFTGLRGGVLSGRMKMVVSTILAIPLGAITAIMVAIALYLILPAALAAIIGAAPVILVAIAGAILGLKISDKIKAKIKKTVVEKVRTELRVSFTKPEVKDKMLDAGRTLVLEIQKKIHSGLQSVITRQSEVFEARCAEATKAFEAGETELRRISKAAGNLRRTYIEPAHAWCESFENSVLAELKA